MFSKIMFFFFFFQTFAVHVGKSKTNLYSKHAQTCVFSLLTMIDSVPMMLHQYAEEYTENLFC